jgi:ACT domain-containing protein
MREMSKDEKRERGISILGKDERNKKNEVKVTLAGTIVYHSSCQYVNMLTNEYSQIQSSIIS